MPLGADQDEWQLCARRDKEQDLLCNLSGKKEKEEIWELENVRRTVVGESMERGALTARATGTGRSAAIAVPGACEKRMTVSARDSLPPSPSLTSCAPGSAMVRSGVCGGRVWGGKGRGERLCALQDVGGKVGEHRAPRKKPFLAFSTQPQKDTRPIRLAPQGKCDWDTQRERVKSRDSWKLQPSEFEV